MLPAVGPIVSTIDTRGAAIDALVPGNQLAARVMQLLPENLVRLAIGNLMIDVQSEVQLLPGQLLQLATSRTAEGIRLAIVGAQLPPAAGDIAGTVTGRPGASVANLPPVLATAVARLQLSASQSIAVAGAAEAAASKQAGLSHLFANLGAVASVNGLPANLQQAVLQLLAKRPNLDADLSAEALKQAVRSSGVFLEAGLASGVAPATGGQGDMKAALLVLRHVLSSFADNTSQAQLQAPQAGAATRPAGAPPSAQASTQPEGVRQQGALPPAALAAATLKTVASGAVQLPDAKALSALVQAATGQLADEAASAPHGSPMQPPWLRSDAKIARLSSHAPPPVRGAMPSAQPVALPLLTAEASVANVAQYLLDDTDAAIARQTLLQIASLPERIDGGARHDGVSRLNFEIPFAMPQGTAVAQFEISRDRGEEETEAAQRIWRARFSLDIEPAGPVHVMISLKGEETSVRMWAERSSTAQRLRDSAVQLNQALMRADLKPGDITIRDGAPMQPPPASAGHFLDRAL